MVPVFDGWRCLNPLMAEEDAKSIPPPSFV